MKYLTLLLVMGLSLSLVSSAYSVIVIYPKEVMIGQPFTIEFGLVTTLINSTDFKYITPGTEVVNVDGMTAYRGFGGYFLADPVNVSGASELVVSFYGRIVGNFTWNPGIILYGTNYSIILAWSGYIYVGGPHKYLAIPALPFFYAGSYKAILTDVDGFICVSSVVINSSTYLVRVNTTVPWDAISYVGVRTDTDTVLPLGFSVMAFPRAYYVIYVNGKEYSSGYADGISNVTLRLFGPAVVNVTFPEYHIYKIITVSASKDSDIRETFPVVQVFLLLASAALVGLALRKEFKKR